MPQKKRVVKFLSLYTTRIIKKLYLLNELTTQIQESGFHDLKRSINVWYLPVMVMEVLTHLEHLRR